MSLVPNIIAFHIGNDIADTYLNLSQDVQVMIGLLSLALVIMTYSYVTVGPRYTIKSASIQGIAIILFIVASISPCVHIKQSIMNLWFMVLLFSVVYFYHKYMIIKADLMRTREWNVILSTLPIKIEVEDKSEKINVDEGDTQLNAVDTDVVPVEEGSGDSGVSLETDVVSDTIIAEDVSASTE